MVLSSIVLCLLLTTQEAFSPFIAYAGFRRTPYYPNSPHAPYYGPPLPPPRPPLYPIFRFKKSPPLSSIPLFRSDKSFLNHNQGLQSVSTNILESSDPHFGKNSGSKSTFTSEHEMNSLIFNKNGAFGAKKVDSKLKSISSSQTISNLNNKRISQVSPVVPDSFRSLVQQFHDK
ncbi:unnamed protein product [Thelazia callipaeda]|uniref:Uncharacterized protein n=1 Tax=Thelazia callipaeda TaxID=103827 RepID=A0A0N5D978_THECL|nr:unnamed protein product [Thelazia callipaeda]